LQGNEIEIFAEFLCNFLFNSVSRTRESDIRDKMAKQEKRKQNNRETDIIYTTGST